MQVLNRFAAHGWDDTGASALPTAADRRIGRIALRGLYREVALAPKPGLVTPFSRGSHADMDFGTFMRSLNSLRPYFPAIAACGGGLPAFASLQRLGVEAEKTMLAATGGINTHRGAIFNLGLLCAAAGQRRVIGGPLDAATVCATVSDVWGREIMASAASAPLSHGKDVACRYGAGGARQEAASGFPAAVGLGLPAYRTALAATGDPEAAAVQALFALIAEVDDTNLLWRGGQEGLAHARCMAADFLAAGGVLAADWRVLATLIDADFSRRRLSPGGSADLLGVTLFLAELEGPA